ncbi:MAG: hypothetical protein ACOC10_06120 [Bacteroidota bacterium]
MVFDAVLNGGLSGDATGVMIFTTRVVADSEEKQGNKKNLYHSLSGK